MATTSKDNDEEDEEDEGEAADMEEFEESGLLDEDDKVKSHKLSCCYDLVFSNQRKILGTSFLKPDSLFSLSTGYRKPHFL